MADMSQVNLERIRATDAMWEESKHPRSENGQFTSGSGSVSATGGGGKFSKPTQSMTGGKFKKPNEEASKIIAEGAKNKEKPQEIISKANRELSKGEAARKTLNRTKGKINAMRSLAEAATPYHAGSPAESSEKFNSVAKMLKNVDSDAYKYAVQMGKVAAKGGEAAAMKWAGQKQKEIEASDMNPVAKGYHKGRLGIVLREYNKGGLKQRKEAREKAEAQSAPKSQASHPMANEVQRDIDYWLQSQHGGNPSEAQRQRAIESIGSQYEHALKSAEKNWNMAQGVPNLDEATRNKYKQKYEAAKGKVEAFKQMHG